MSPAGPGGALGTLLLFLGLLTSTRDGEPTNPPASSEASIALQAKEVFTANCYRCHGQDGSVEGDINFILNRKKLVDSPRHLIVPGDARRSVILAQIRSGGMPFDRAIRSPKDQAVVESWVLAGAPDWESLPPKRDFITDAQVVARMWNDIRGLDEQVRPYTRYFTLTHLYNSGLSADELRTYRHGLTKLLNSLSRGPDIVQPVAIDSESTIFRIDVRDLDWARNDRKVWEIISEANPYKFVPDTREEAALEFLTSTALPYARADWFVATASHPPLYEEVLRLPSSERELEAELGIDVESDLANGRATRIGISNSGISEHNRMIERHPIGSGALWRSFDFRGDTDEKSIFQNPTGPGSTYQAPSSLYSGSRLFSSRQAHSAGFRHDGGEVIFNLPNHLQAYMLVNADGHRISKAPEDIVSDKSRPDRRVENGISCMKCHVHGIIDASDQIREHVITHPDAFTPEQTKSVERLHVAPEKVRKLLAQDRQRFMTALAAAGIPVEQETELDRVSEPISALAARFEAPLDIVRTASELGITPAQLKSTLHDKETPGEVVRALGLVEAANATIKRAVFLQVYPAAAKAMKVEREPDSDSRHREEVGLAAQEALLGSGNKHSQREGKSEPALVTSNATPERGPVFSSDLEGLMVVGACLTTEITFVQQRFVGDDESGAVVKYKNGLVQESGQPQHEALRSVIGDHVQVCLISIPPNCPPGDMRGRLYQTKNLRTGRVWNMSNSIHQCGGA